MGFFSWLFDGSGEDSDSEYLGSDTDFEDAAVLQKTAIQHELIISAFAQIHQHEIDRFEIVRRTSPGVADKFYVPGRCDPFPDIDFVAEVKAETDRLNRPETPDSYLPEDIPDRWF